MKLIRNPNTFTTFSYNIFKNEKKLEKIEVMVRSEIGRRRFLSGTEMAPAPVISRRRCSMSPTLETIFEERSDDFNHQDQHYRVVVGQRHRLFLLVPAIISAVSCVLLCRQDRVVRFS